MRGRAPVPLERAADIRARLLEDAAARFAFGAWSLDLASGRYVGTESLARLLQWEAALDALDFDALRTALLEPGRTAFELAIERARSRGTPWDFGARLRQRDGTEQFVQLRGAALVENGRCIGLRGAVQLLPAASSNIESRDNERAQRGLVQRLELAAAAAGVGFFEVGPAAADNTWSARMREIYGLDPTSPPPDRETWRRVFLHPDDAAAQEAAILASFRSGTYEHEHRIIRADGAVRWVYSHAVVDSQSERRWLGIAMDITERKLGEQQLHEALDRLALATKGSGVGVWQRDLDRDIAHWSDELFPLYGLPQHRGAPDWKELVAIVHPDDRALFESQWQDLVGSTEFIDSEYRVRHPDGRTRWILTRGRHEPGRGAHRGRIVGVALDITERKAAEQRARDAGRWLEIASQAMRLGLWRRDLATDTLHWNAELRRIFGLAETAPDPTLDQVLEYVLPEDRPKVLASRQGPDARREIVEVEYRVRRADGEIRTLLSRGAAQQDLDGKPSAAYSAIIDVTDQRRAAVALEQTLERLKVAAETGGVGVWERDLATDAAHWDPVLWTLYGLAPRETGPSRAEAERYVHPDDRATVDAAWRRLQEVDHAVEYEFRVPRADGSLAYLNSRGRCIRDAAGKPLRVVGATIDVTSSRNAQRQLREMDEFVKLASVVTGVGFFRIGLDSTTSFTDAQLKRIFGFDPAGGEPSRDAFESRILPEDRPILHNVRELVRGSAQPVGAEYRIRLPDGSLRHIFTRRALVRDESGRPMHVLGTAIDVTSTHTAEQERERLAQRIELATSELQLGLWEWDPLAHTSVWNDQMYTLFGHSRESFAGLTWLDAVHPDDRATALNELKTVVAEGRNFDYEFRIVRPDGEVRWIASRGRAQRDPQGLTTRVFGINVDITERHSAELERAALAKRMQLAADAAHIGLWERDAEGDEGNWNSANFALWGLPRNVRAPSTEQVTERVHPDDRAAFRAQFREAAAGREPDDLEYRVVHGDGRMVVLRTRVRPVTTSGRSLRIVGVNIDVTQQRLAEQALIAKEMAERANQAKTEFLSRMSHELRTPLNAILGFAQLLELNPAERLSPQQRANVDHIQKAGWHLVSLIDEVLDLARIESGRMALTIARIALQGVIEESLAMIHADAVARGLHVEQHTLPDAPAHVSADRVRLKQVLVNLLSNAVKYNADNGRVGIEVAAGAEHSVRITVRDTGRGMSATQLANVFEPFNRLGLENSGIAGTGIGLSITRRLVEQMKGSIEVMSEEGVGTRFVVTLPAAAPVAPTPTEPVAAGALRRDDLPGTVLYVEDNESNIQLVEQLLALRPRVKLLVARDSTSARVLAAVTQPDIVLVDMRLPDAIGIDVLHALRAQAHMERLTCIAISANALPEDIAAARAAGFDDYLTKPLDAEHFLARIDAALTRPAAAALARSPG